MSTRLERRHVHKAVSYTINSSVDRCGTVFSNRGASGAITYTLPRPTRALLGHWYRFLALVAQALVVASPTADTLVTLNDLTADSVSVPTIGGEMEAECVETASGVFQWVVTGLTVGHVYTVVTA